MGTTPPPLGPVGASLAAMGATGLMDASVSTGPEEAAIPGGAVRAGNRAGGAKGRCRRTVPRHESLKFS